MIALFRRACLIFAFSTVSACTSVPDFSNPSRTNGDGQTGISVEDVVEHIRCELQNAAKERYPYSYDNMMLKDFDAYVVLNLKVDDSGNLLPSTTFIQPYPMMQNRSLSINLQYGESRERTFTQGYLFDVYEIAAAPSCQDVKKDNIDLWAPNLRGDLGLSEIARIGLTSISAASLGVKPASFGSGSGYYSPSPPPPPPPSHSPSELPQVQPTPPTATPAGSSSASTSGCNPAAPTLTFGSSMQFALTKGFGGGPSWTLTHFKFGSGGGGGGGSSSGGSGGSGSSGGGGGGGPINVSRIDTDQLWITFAPNPDSQTRALRSAISNLEVSINEKNLNNFANQRDTKALLNKQHQLQNALQKAEQEVPAKRADAACAFSSAVPTMIFQNLSSPLP